MLGASIVSLYFAHQHVVETRFAIAEQEALRPGTDSLIQSLLVELSNAERALIAMTAEVRHAFDERYGLRSTLAA
jgi:hypothetical protein